MAARQIAATVTYLIYARDSQGECAGEWFPAVSLGFASPEGAERVLATLQREFPTMELRIEFDCLNLQGQDRKLFYGTTSDYRH
jgi:hypothetical protein